VPDTASSKLNIWRLCCSLKLAIELASLVTLLIMYGSLVMHAHPELFGNLDQQSLGSWIAHLSAFQAKQTWWMFASGLLILLLGLNALCCFVDWATHLKSRWRKTGEYLIHGGFVLLVAALVWGSYSGIRNDSMRVFLSQRTSMPGLAGVELIVDAAEPVTNRQGRLLDMSFQVRLIQGEKLLRAEQLRINHPLLYHGLVVVPVSLGREVQGFDCFMPGVGTIRLVQGEALTLAEQKTLRVVSFIANARKTAAGQVVAHGTQLLNPALLLELSGPGLAAWRGWYFLREQFPYPLIASGIRFWPVEPVFNEYAVLTFNHDPAAGVALAGGCLILIGTLLALVSFYRKRRANDRPVL
jgi:cytochrome c biogenesis protein